MNSAIKGIRLAARKRERAIEAREGATAELREQIKLAQAEGVSISQIAREANLSRQGVYDLLGPR
jgi:DNA invertase Pin-like site-specific DNA recombinase